LKNPKNLEKTKILKRGKNFKKPLKIEKLKKKFKTNGNFLFH